MTQGLPYNWYTPGEDPEDEELGIGVFRYPDGTSRYGQDAEGAQSLRAAGKVGPPPGDVLPPGIKDPNEYGPPTPPTRAARTDVEAPGGVDIPASSRLAHVNNNPGNLRFAGQAGATEGEKGYARFETPEAGAAALYRQIDLDAGRGMTLKQFVNKYAPPSENDTGLYVKQMTEFTGASEDTPIGQIDRDKLAQAIARKESSSTLGGGGPPSLAPATTPRTSAAPPGMVMSEVSQTGIPLTPQQLQEREGQINTQVAGEREARGAALLDQRQALQNVQDQQVQVAQQREQQAKADQQREELVQKEASQRIDTELTQPVQKVDPKRYIKNMSTAQQVFGILGLLTSAVGQGLMMKNGQGNVPNIALQWLDKAIDQDIEDQREEIQQGQVSSKNRVAHWTRVFDNAEAGKTAAKLEAEQAVNARLKANLLDVDDADLQAQAVAVDQELQRRALDSVNELRENEANKLRMKYEAPAVQPRPVGPVPTGPNDPIKTSPEYRAQVAAHFNEEKDGPKLEKFKEGLNAIKGSQQALQELETLYKVSADDRGQYPAQADYASGGTGPGYNPTNWEILSNERDRQIKKAWGAVMGAARMDWKSEPNGVAIQQLLMNLDVPDRDNDVPLSLAKVRAALDKSEQLLESGTLPQVRAYFWSQQGPPVGATRVTGRVP
jgi:hypothetical protein